MPKSFRTLSMLMVCSLSIVLLLVSSVVFLASDIVVLKQSKLPGRTAIGLAVQSRGKDGIHGAEGTGVVSEGTPGGGFDPCRIIVFRQLEYPHAGTVALLRILAGGYDLGYQFGRGGTDLAGPLDKPFQTPFRISLVLRRHVLP